MLRNVNHHHHHHHHHSTVNGGPAVAVAVAATVGPTVVSPQAYAQHIAAAAVRPVAAAAAAAVAVTAATAASVGAATGGFSIYSPNISFEQDYRSNYTYQNARFVLDSSAESSSLGNSLRASPAKSPPTLAVNARAAEELMAGLQRKGYYIVKNVKTVPRIGGIGVSCGGGANNNNSVAVANNNLRAGHQQAHVVSKGIVESLHNYSKQQCEEETDRLRHKAAAAMRNSNAARYHDDDGDDDDDDDDDDEEEEVEEYEALENNVHDDDVDVDVVEPVDVETATGNDDDVDVDVVHSDGELDHSNTATMPSQTVQTAAPEEKPAPEHHARRPMNAFLIFCKRHRGIVREKYPNLENRAITKILGDWWANMDGPEKECFNRLAREYKDAFFSANPTFQWYKLPAPPLRTLSSRPCTVASPHQHNGQHPESAVLQTRISTSSAHVGMFKLADTAQMGGLNELMGGAGTEVLPTIKGGSQRTFSREQRSEADRKNSDLQAALGDATSFFAKTMSTNRTEAFRHYRVVKRKSDPGAIPAAAASETSPPPAKRSVSESSIVTSPADFERFVQANLRVHELEPGSSEDDCAGTSVASGSTAAAPANALDESHSNNNLNAAVYTKSTRACKGKRYLEFINTVRVATAAPKKPAKSAAVVTATSTTAAAFRPMSAHRNVDYESFDHMYASQAPADHQHPLAAPAPTTSTTTAKTLIDTTTDFDLDGKIKALHALSLDEYLARKRDTKKKKKITTAKKTSAASVRVPAPISVQVGKTKASQRMSPAAARQQLQAQQTMRSAAQQLQQQQQQQLQQQQQQQQHNAQLAALMRAQTALERREQLRQSAVGSQKRKARKESITRRDVVLNVSEASSVGGQQPLTVLVYPSSPATQQQQPAPLMPMVCASVSPTPQVASPDLFILAQVAAIITNK